jgi:N-methylhydantoinase B/oxoprolinase/acetone carboxylase alpha subunit
MGCADALAVDVAEAGSVLDPTSPAHAVARRATTTAIRRLRICRSVVLTGSARIRFGAL